MGSVLAAGACMPDLQLEGQLGWCSSQFTGVFLRRYIEVTSGTLDLLLSTPDLQPDCPLNHLFPALSLPISHNIDHPKCKSFNICRTLTIVDTDDYLSLLSMSIGSFVQSNLVFGLPPVQTEKAGDVLSVSEVVLVAGFEKGQLECLS